MGYPGGKSGPGVYHRLINLMPPHPVYCEPFLGGGAVMRLKRPAAYNIGVDLDAEVIASWRSHTGENAVKDLSGESAGARGTAEKPGGAAWRDLVGAAGLPLYPGAVGPPSVPGSGAHHQAAYPPLKASGGRFTAGRSRTAAVGGAIAAPVPEYSGGSLADCGSAAGRSSFRFLRGDGLTFLASYPFQPTDLIYCDPPYLMETRSGGRLYRHEMSDEQHAELLATILELPCRVMISGYWSEMYTFRLKRWNCIHFEAMTRGGMATEWLWFNFAEPVELHDYQFLGENTRQRQDLKRQIASWAGKLERMPPLKKRALLAAIADAGVSRCATNGKDRTPQPAKRQALTGAHFRGFCGGVLRTPPSACRIED
jgi:hypothetical protein